MAELGAEAGLLPVAQAILDRELVTDVEQLQECVNEAYGRAQRKESAPPLPELPNGPGGEMPPAVEEVGSSSAETGERTPTDIPAGFGTIPGFELSGLASVSELLPEGVGALMERLLDTTRAVEASDLHVSAGKIIRDGRTHHLQGVIQTGIREGMQTMDQSVLQLFQAGLISRDLATEYIKSKNALQGE